VFSESFWISVISAIVGPSVVLWIANRIRNGKPKVDRIDTAFEVYEKIMKRQDAEITQKDTLIDKLKQRLDQYEDTEHEKKFEP
jgi:hypothetical protein